MCSLDCDELCPDQDGAVETFCLDPGSLGTTAASGLCSTRCDYGVSSTGCRAGYQCQPHARFGDPTTVAYVCVPGDDAPFVLSACHEELLARGIPFSPAVNPLDSPDGHPDLVCDIEDPVWIGAWLHDVAHRPGSMSADPSSMFVACPFALSLDRAAEILADANVTDVMHYGTYNCRVVAGTDTLSEHGLANAIDYAGVKTADGSVFSVLDDWEMNQPNPVTEGGQLLGGFAQTCFDEEVFNIILSPNYNAAHADHLHCDLTPGEHFFQ
jgi:hypothetical protein